MCGRMTLTRREWDDVLSELAALLAGAGPLAVDQGAAALYRPRYNVAPSQPHPIVRRKSGRPGLGFAEWGLLARGRGKPPAINVRAETAPFKPAFQEAFVTRRCVIPADGFFEWQSGPTGRRPLWFHRPDGRLLLLAGLFDDETAESGFVRFGVITTGPNRLTAPVHDRMPALLSPEEAVAWLAEPSQKLLHPAPEELLVATPVSLRVNSVRNDDPECLAPPAASGQRSLF
jgi:putative SOS response-associated peptidase YedK